MKAILHLNSHTKIDFQLTENVAYVTPVNTRTYAQQLLTEWRAVINNDYPFKFRLEIGNPSTGKTISIKSEFVTKLKGCNNHDSRSIRFVDDQDCETTALKPPRNDELERDNRLFHDAFRGIFSLDSTPVPQSSIKPVKTSKPHRMCMSSSNDIACLC